MRFLEREVYTFCGERVRGAMPWARIFFVYGRAAGASGRPAADGPRGSTRELWAEQRGMSDTQRCAKKGKKDVFSGKRLEGCLLCPPGGSRGRSAAIAALGYGHRREKRRAQLRLGVEHGWKPSL